MRWIIPVTRTAAPGFVESFERMANLATRPVSKGMVSVILKAPLQNSAARYHLKAGIGLGVDYSLTVSCYQADNGGRR